MACASIAAIGEYFGGAAAVSGADAAVAGSAVVGTGTAAGGATAGVAGTAAAGGTTLAGAAGQAAAGALAAGAVNAALAPKPPKVPGMAAMPDAQAQEEARKRSIAESMARSGRASTMLTDSSGGKLGG